MIVGIAQINTKLGDVATNARKHIEVIDKIGSEVQLLLFSEMSLTGYPLHDRIYDKNLLKAQHAAMKNISEHIYKTQKNLTVVLGCIDFDTTKIGPDGKWFKWNAAAVLNGKEIEMYHKQLLPTYDVFYDDRYFQPGNHNTHIDLPRGKTAALTICEDMRTQGYYENNPITQTMGLDQQKANVPDYLINISSSPYDVGKIEKRLNVILQHVKNTGVPFIYVNQVGGQDGHVYDGHSMVVNAKGEVIHFGKGYEEEIAIVDLSKKVKPLNKKVIEVSNDKYGNILEAIKLGTKDYLKKTGIKDVIIGVSGGIDSALSLYILTQILPKERIHAYYLPYQAGTVSKSLGYVKELCGNLGVDFQEVAIDSTIEASIQEIEKSTGQKVEGLALENIQAQTRGLKLMTFSRMIGGVVINNSNRTEIAQGYATIYGDTIGFISIIGDLIKTEVYQLAEYINKQHQHDVDPNKTDIIPNSIINRVASAELKEGQVDPFDYHRAGVCEGIDELFNGEDADEVAKKYNLSKEEVATYLKNIDRNEFKRKQSPTVIKLKSPSVGGGGRLYPIVYGA